MARLTFLGTADNYLFETTAQGYHKNADEAKTLTFSDGTNPVTVLVDGVELSSVDVPAGELPPFVEGPDGLDILYVDAGGGAVPVGPVGAGVQSYNDLTDKPVIPTTAAEVGALPDTTVIPSSAADVNALPDTTTLPDLPGKATDAQLPDRLQTTALAGTYVPQSGLRYGTKSGRLSISGGTNGTNSALTGITWRIPVVLPVTTTRWRLKWRNFNTKANTPLTGVTGPTLKGLYVGTETLDADGVGTGNFTAAPTQVIAETSLPTDGSTYTSAWITDAAAQFTAGQPMLWSTGLTGNGAWGYCRSQQKFVNSAGPVSSQTIGTFNGTFPMYGEWWIEYEYVGAEAVGLFIGDSLTDGYSPTGKIPQSRNYPNTWALRERTPAASLAVFGLDASDIAGIATTDHFWTKYGLGNGWTPDFAVVWLGSNDLNDGRTDAQLKADLGTIYNRLKAFGIPRIFAATVTPRNLGVTPEGYRTAINTWLLSRPHQLRDVFEFDRTVTLSATATTLDDSRVADSDGIHFKPEGYSRLARAVPHIG